VSRRAVRCRRGGVFDNAGDVPPVIDPSGSCGKSFTSPRLSENVCTLTKAWSGSGTGSSTGLNATCGAAEVVISASIAHTLVIRSGWLADIMGSPAR
jgi:hypothetical protein